MEVEMSRENRDLSNRFEQALVYAHRLHAKQKRKSTSIPYISHLLAVASLVLEDGGDEDQAIAALLHDAAEDQGGVGTLNNIRTQFGERVARIVNDCTDAMKSPKPPWRERKNKYIEHLRTVPTDSRRVSLADKLHNARAILLTYRFEGEKTWSRFNGGRDGTLWYYQRLLQVFQETGEDQMTWELERVLNELYGLMNADERTLK